jgi:hypothetical protein
MHGRQESVSAIEQISEHEHHVTPDEDSTPTTQGSASTVSKKLLPSSASLVGIKNTYN